MFNSQSNIVDFSSDPPLSLYNVLLLTYSKSVLPVTLPAYFKVTQLLDRIERWV